MPTQLKIFRGDMTQLSVDAIINAAKESLLGGGGVDGAIHRAAGPELLKECRTLGGCPTGQAKITRGYRLPAQYVIHTVGPIWQGGQAQEAQLLRACYLNSLTLALEKHLKTLAFPAISCGIYGYPIKQATAIAVQTVAHFTTSHPDIDLVYFTVFNQEIEECYQNALAYLNEV